MDRKQYDRMYAQKRWISFKKAMGYDITFKRYPDYDKENFCAGCEIALPKTKNQRCPKCGMKMRIGPVIKKKVFRY